MLAVHCRLECTKIELVGRYTRRPWEKSRLLTTFKQQLLTLYLMSPFLPFSPRASRSISVKVVVVVVLVLVVVVVLVLVVVIYSKYES